jgi:hypothetical protein
MNSMWSVDCSVMMLAGLPMTLEFDLKLSVVS